MTKPNERRYKLYNLKTSNFIADMKFLCSFLWLASTGSIIDGQPVMRYTTNSCSGLEPEYMHESYSDLKLGPFTLSHISLEDGNGNVPGSPKKLNTRQIPFIIEFEFNEYRANKKYEVKLVAFERFDGFVLQSRGQLLQDSSVTFIGEFTNIPTVAQYLSCGSNSTRSTVIDRSRPIEMGNLTFTWKAPSHDMGPLRFIASIVYNDAYVIVNSNQIQFNAKPLVLPNCEKGETCVRACASDPNCPADSTDFLYMFGPEERSSSYPTTIIFRMGAYLKPNSENYVGIGFGEDPYYLKNLDIVACFRSENEVKLGHYFLEDSSSQPYFQKQPLQLEDARTDQNGFTICQFARPIYPREVLDLDLLTPMYHFYLSGNMTQDMRVQLPPLSRIQHSNYKHNISDTYNDIRFIGLSSQIVISNFLISLSALTLVYIGV